MFLLAAFSVATCTPAQSPEPATALLNVSRAIALNPESGKIYAVATKQNSVAFHNTSTSATSLIQTGASPVALTINQVTNRIYVANSDSGTVSVLDGATDAVLTTLDVGPNPYVLVADQLSNKIFLSNTFSDKLTIIDGATNSITKLKAVSANVLAVDEKLSKIYLLGYEDENLNVFDEKSLTFSRIKIGMHQWSIAIDPATHMAYVTRSGYAELAAINPLTGSVTKIPTGATPCAVALNPATKTLYVSNHTDDSVTTIDATNYAVIATIKVGHRPQGIAVDPIRNRIYVANRNDNSISVIDGSKNQVTKTLPVGSNPFALVVNPKTGQLFAATIAGPPLELISEK